MPAHICTTVEVIMDNAPPEHARFLFFDDAGQRYYLIANGPKRLGDIKRTLEYLSQSWPRANFSFESQNGKVTKVL